MLYNIFEQYNYLILIHDGETFTINKDHTDRYEKVKEHLLKSEFDEVEKYLWTNMFDEYDGVEVLENNIFYKNKKIPSTLADILFSKRKDNQDIKEFLKFFDSLEYNEDFKNNKIKKLKFYKSLSSVYPLGDIALYDSKEEAGISGMKSLASFNERFSNELKRIKDVELALESIAGFKSKNLIKLFKKEIHENNNNYFVDFLILVKDLLSPNLIYSLWEHCKEDYSLRDPFFLNEFLLLNKRSEKGIYNYLIKNKTSKLNELNAVLFRYEETMIEVPELLEAGEMAKFLVLYYKRKMDADFDLKQEKNFPEIKDCELKIDESLSLKFPENKDDLVNWSTLMSNCISSYALSAKNGTCLLVAVYENDKIKYTIEVTPKRDIKQFVSYGNGRVTLKVKEKVLAHLKKNLIIKS